MVAISIMDVRLRPRINLRPSARSRPSCRRANSRCRRFRPATLGHRYYSPVTGRWLSRDPIAEEGGINLYGYVFNFATGAIDTDGRQTFLLSSPASTFIPRIAQVGEPVVRLSTETSTETISGGGAGAVQFFGPKPLTAGPQVSYPVPASVPMPQSVSLTSSPKTKTTDLSYNYPDYYFRAMNDDGMGYPRTGEGVDDLGVRIGQDITFLKGFIDMVGPQKSGIAGKYHGMSVNWGTWELIPPMILPKDFGYAGRAEAVYRIRRSDIDGPLLEFHPKDDQWVNGIHGVMSPKHCMPYKTYKAALEATKYKWERVKTPVKYGNYQGPLALNIIILNMPYENAHSSNV